ncbi:CsiV family protein [Halioxenophilus sp. WMMB6]|uniref:CsiV family protein n=1 Tax=Halioxenophilus sp. WMMB6 TaxID=3073815 RepID=UPI00295EE2DE|nr:CsiV family protein [Halioxenophilus sp. WMMB6]
MLIEKNLFNRPWQRTLATIAMVLSSSSLFAQDQTNWYQVEIVVFSQTLRAADAQEAWPTDIALAYPPGTVTLFDPSAPPPASEETLAEGGSALSSMTTPASGDQSLENDNPVGDANLAPEGPTPFSLVDDDSLALNNIASKLTRNSNYRVLRHVAWIQPALASKEAKSVVLTGGDLFDNHHELEGTVTLRVARYLHLDVNLWLTQFYPNYGQESGYTVWPQLPEIPTVGHGGPLSASTSSGPIDFNFSLSGGREETHSGFNGFETKSASSTAKSPGYIIERIILHKQSRKMRSNEIHYIDHPVLGLVVKVTPWTAPETIEPASETAQGSAQ